MLRALHPPIVYPNAKSVTLIHTKDYALRVLYYCKPSAKYLEQKATIHLRRVADLQLDTPVWHPFYVTDFPSLTLLKQLQNSSFRGLVNAYHYEYGIFELPHHNSVEKIYKLHYLESFQIRISMIMVFSCSSMPNSIVSHMVKRICK